MIITTGSRTLKHSEAGKDNNKKYFIKNSFGVIENGYLVEFWGTQIDISENKKTEENLFWQSKKLKR